MTIKSYEIELGTEVWDAFSEHSGRFIPRDDVAARYLLFCGLGHDVTLEQMRGEFFEATPKDAAPETK